MTMITETSLASRTDGQADEFTKTVEAAARTAAEAALSQVVSDREGWQRALDRSAELKSAIIEATVAKTRELVVTNEALRDWQKFYREMFGIELDMSTIKIPAKRQGFDRLLVIAKGLLIQQVYDKCRELFPCWKYTDSSLDEVVTINDRDPKNGAYAVWARDRVEADDEHKNKSAIDLAVAKVVGITLLERLIYELKYWKETGKHLDIQNVTLCSGSRGSGGHVPDVYWVGDGELGVDWCSPDHRGGILSSREVV